MKNLLISIVVPVYNVEEFLTKCIDSILAQTYGNFELLLIDDGSKDSSGEICDAYLKRDKRIKVFHLENGGVSNARNFGIDQALGEFISFIDSDDWIDDDYLEHFWVNGNDFDLLVSGHSMQNSDYSWKTYIPELEIFANKQFLDFYEKNLSEGVIRAPWCKLFSLEIIKKYGLRFNSSLSFGEDTIFTLQFLRLIKSISIINYRGYYRRYTSGSLSKTVNYEGWNKFIDNYQIEYGKTVDEYGEAFGLKKDLANRCLYILVLKIKYAYSDHLDTKSDRIRLIEKEFRRMQSYSLDYRIGVWDRFSKLVVCIYKQSTSLNKFDILLTFFVKMMKRLKKIQIRIVEIKYYLVNSVILKIPSRRLRLFVIRRLLSRVGEGVGFLRFIELRNPKNIYIGDHSVINQKVLLDGRGGNLIIGNNVDIAQETNIWTLEHDPHSDYHETRGNDVIVEDFVWIASRVTILPGVKIGQGAVIAANSVVTKNVPPMSIAAGIPAKVIGKRESKLLYTLNYRPWLR